MKLGVTFEMLFFPASEEEWVSRFWWDLGYFSWIKPIFLFENSSIGIQNIPRLESQSWSSFSLLEKFTFRV